MSDAALRIAVGLFVLMMGRAYALAVVEVIRGTSGWRGQATVAALVAALTAAAWWLGGGVL